MSIEEYINECKIVGDNLDSDFYENNLNIKYEGIKFNSALYFL